MDEFLRNGKSDEEYQEIKRGIIRNRVPSRLPKLTLLAGVPGSGKSTISRALTEDISPSDKESFDLILSPDDLKQELLHKLEVTEANEVEWRMKSQKEAWEMARDTLFASLLRGHNVMYDATLGNSDKYIEIFTFIASNNLDYEIELNLVHVDLPVALDRARVRGLKDKHTVPESAIISIYNAIPANIIKLFPFIDIFTFWDNNMEQPNTITTPILAFREHYNTLHQNRFLKMYVDHLNNEIYVVLANGIKINAFFGDISEEFSYKLLQYDVEFEDSSHDYLNI